MKIIYSSVTAIILTIFLVSCQKEVDLQTGGGGGTVPKDITGNYKFISITANTKATVVAGTGTAQEKLITTSNYTTTNNVGTIAITSTDFTTTGVGYTAAGVATNEYYLGGALIQSIDVPFDEDIPPTSDNSKYKRINNDSLYFDDGDPTGASVPIGARISWAGDTLIMKMAFSITSTEDLGGGIMAQVTQAATELVKLKKL